MVENCGPSRARGLTYGMRSMALAPFFLLAAALAAHAQVRYPARPGDREFIVDEAGLLQPEAAAEIRRLANEALTKKKAPIVVVTIKSLADYGAAGWAIERYAMNLFSEWGIGWQDWNHGMLLLVSTGDRKARIEMGAGWGHQKDGDAQRLMNELIVPNFKRGDFGRGILEGVKGLQALAMGLSPQRGAARDRACGQMSGLGWPIVLVIAVAVLGSMFRGRSGYGGGCSPLGMGCLGGLLGSMLGNLFSGGSSWGDSGGSDWGGGSFGGGSSGGGGATGSW